MSCRLTCWHSAAVLCQALKEYGRSLDFPRIMRDTSEGITTIALAVFTSPLFVVPFVMGKLTYAIWRQTKREGCQLVVILHDNDYQSRKRAKLASRAEGIVIITTWTATELASNSGKLTLDSGYNLCKVITVVLVGVGMKWLTQRATKHCSQPRETALIARGDNKTPHHQLIEQ